MFQSWDGDVAIYLQLRISKETLYLRSLKTHALFHVLLTGHHGFLPNLEAHLGGLIVHEAAKCGRELASSTRLLGVPPDLTIGSPIIRTSLRLGRGRRAHHWDGRYMLRYRVVKWRRVRRGRSVRASLHIWWAIRLSLIRRIIKKRDVALIKLSS